MEAHDPQTLQMWIERLAWAIAAIATSAWGYVTWLHRERVNDLKEQLRREQEEKDRDEDNGPRTARGGPRKK
jgi:hypothetical protein